SRPKTLVDGAMFAVHRQDFGSPLPRCSCDQLTCRDKILLVRQPDSFSSLDRLIGCNQPRRPMGSRHDSINLRMCRSLDLPAHPTGDLNGWGNSKISKSLAQGLNPLRISNHHQLGSEIVDLLGEQLQVLSGAEGDHLKSVRGILDDTETLPPNRTRRAQNTQTLGHRQTSIIARASHRTGAPNNRLSTLSSKPPWPGNADPESFKLAPRFIADSARSPICPNSAIKPANRITVFKLAVCQNKRANPQATRRLPINPATDPSRVFLGEMEGKSIFRPIVRPTRYAKVSSAQITRNKSSISFRPPGVSAMPTRPRLPANRENLSGSKQESVNPI